MWDYDLKLECDKGNHIWQTNVKGRMLCKTCGKDCGLTFELWHLRAKEIARKICATKDDKKLFEISLSEHVKEDDLIYIKEKYGNHPLLQRGTR